MKIYDGFLFFNELDLLDLRLNTLNHIVDYFVLVESSVTHSGKSKTFIFEENKKLFDKFLNKIIHIKVDNTPEDFINLPVLENNCYKNVCFNNIYKYIQNTNLFNKYTEKSFGRDFFQKECVKLGLENCNDEDIILFSDLDEIPNPEYLERLNEFFSPDEFYSFNQKHYCYYFNLLSINHNNDNIWIGSKMSSFKKIKNYSLNELRTQRNDINLINGGWHFSYMGGLEKVKVKMQSFSHQECNTEKINFNIEDMFLNNKKVDFRGNKSELVQIDDSYPKYLKENLEKFKKYIK